MTRTLLTLAALFLPAIASANGHASLEDCMIAACLVDDPEVEFDGQCISAVSPFGLNGVCIIVDNTYPDPYNPDETIVCEAFKYYGDYCNNIE